MRPSLRWLLSYGLSAPNLTPHTQLWGAGPGTLQTIFPLGLLGTPGMDAGGRLEAGVERGDLFPVILVSPGCNHMHPYKKKAGRSNSDTQSRSHTKRRGQHDPGGSEWTDADTGPGTPSKVTASGAGRGEERSTPRVHRGSTALPTAWLSDSGLQN